MSEERVMLAEALFALASEEQKGFIRRYKEKVHKIVNNESLSIREVNECLDELEEVFQEKVTEKGLMTKELFEALVLAYSIINE